MKAVVLAAGQGTRLLPLTATRPKVLLPVGGKPILTHVVMALRKAGIRETIIVVGYMGEKIREAIGRGTNLGVKVDYVEQRMLDGTGSALKCVEKLVENEEFLVINGDVHVAPSSVEKAVNTHRKHGGNVISAVYAETPGDYGVVTVGKRGFVVAIDEKPSAKKAAAGLVNAGIYVFSNEVFDALRCIKPSVRDEIELTAAIMWMKKQGEEFRIAKLNPEEWMDIGRPWDLLNANERALESLQPNEEGRIEPGVSVKGKLILSRGAMVRRGSHVEGPVFIGEGSVVGPNCYLRPYTSVGNHVKIGNACEIKGSIILDYTRIPHLSYVGDSVVGENCNLGAGTVVGNIRFDEKNVGMMVKDVVSDSGRKKLGVILGDGVKTGVNVSFSPGVKAGPFSFIGANIIVYRDVPPNTKVLLKQELTFEPMGG